MCLFMVNEFYYKESRKYFNSMIIVNSKVKAQYIQSAQGVELRTRKILILS